MNIRKYGLFAAIASAVLIPIVFFGIIGNNFLPTPDSDNQNGKSQQIDDANLRGAVDADSAGKQISEENKR